MPETTTVIYNADCPVCAREIAGYRRYCTARGLPVRFEDLDGAERARWGLTAEAAARRLHVVHEGRLHAGVAAFAILWAEMPRLRWLARLVRLPGVFALAAALYEGVLAPVLYALHRRRVRRANACG